MRTPMKFTLIELLVVIAVIVILFSLLLPALGRAKDMGRQVACSGNFKALFQATAMYSDDYGGYILPAQDADVFFLSCYWFRHVVDELGISRNSGLAKNGPKGVFVCPSSLGVSGAYFHYDVAPYNFYNSYSINIGISYYCKCAWSPLPVKFPRITQPASSCLYTEYNSAFFYDYSVDQFKWVHNGAQNFAFCDGHVESRRRGAVPTSKSDVFFHGNVCENR